MLYQLAAAELDGKAHVVAAIGIANPFLFDNLRSLLLHWGCSEGPHAQWAPPPRGWHTSPGVSQVRAAAWRACLAAVSLLPACLPLPSSRMPALLTGPSPPRPS